jgi:hypothetical protein
MTPMFTVSLFWNHAILRPATPHHQSIVIEIPGGMYARLRCTSTSVCFIKC